jgi:hypothetical protein
MVIKMDSQTRRLVDGVTGIPRDISLKVANKAVDLAITEPAHMTTHRMVEMADVDKARTARLLNARSINRNLNTERHF